MNSLFFSNRDISRFIFFFFLLVGCKAKAQVLPSTRNYTLSEFCMGADLSYLNQLDDNGAKFLDAGKQQDAINIFKDHGANLVRIRLWHTPNWQLPVTGGRIYSDLADAEKLIRRAKAAGMAVNLDLHYSDDWADPQKQEIPAAWKNLPLAILKDSVYRYTLSVLQYLSTKNLIPEMIQIGNETNNGMLWPVGQIQNGDATNFAALLNSGIKAVRDFSVNATIKPQIIIHEAQLQTAGNWTALLTKAGVTDYDILGLSHYSKWSTINTMSSIRDTISMLVKNYHRTVMVVEAGYPWTGNNADTYNNLFSPTDFVSGYPLSKEMQLQYMKDLVQAIIDGGGKGIMYWEPEWISSPMKDRWGTGSSWENLALFDFQGNVLPAMDFMRLPYQF
jgi:arabinogalactan endo-1,4-beta-galactosidase